MYGGWAFTGGVVSGFTAVPEYSLAFANSGSRVYWYVGDDGAGGVDLFELRLSAGGGSAVSSGLVFAFS
eukprot:2759735-Rhodomonas_salina.1